MTRDEFVAGYAARSGVAVAELLEWLKPLPCYCGEPECQGWAMVSPDLESHHMRLYGQPPHETTAQPEEGGGPTTLADAAALRAAAAAARDRGDECTDKCLIEFSDGTRDPGCKAYPRCICGGPEGNAE